LKWREPRFFTLLAKGDRARAERGIQDNKLIFKILINNSTFSIRIRNGYFYSLISPLNRALFKDQLYPKLELILVFPPFLPPKI
jgi:hypothetical protein